MEKMWTDMGMELKGSTLTIHYGQYPDESKQATMELKSEAECELVKMMLESNELWASFLGSLSAAIKEKFN